MTNRYLKSFPRLYNRLRRWIRRRRKLQIIDRKPAQAAGLGLVLTPKERRRAVADFWHQIEDHRKLTEILREQQSQQPYLSRPPRERY